MATRSGVRLVIQIEGEALASGSGINGATSSILHRHEVSWAQGTSAGGVDLVYAEDLTVSTSPTDLDLAGGSNVKNPASQADQTYTKVHAVWVINTHDANDVTVFGDANGVLVLDDATDSMTLKPGESHLYAAASGADGRDVTAGTGDIIQIAGSGAGTTCKVIIIGR